MKSSIKRIVVQSKGLAYFDSKGSVRYSEAKDNENKVNKIKKLIQKEKHAKPSS